MLKLIPVHPICQYSDMFVGNTELRWIQDGEQNGRKDWTFYKWTANIVTQWACLFVPAWTQSLEILISKYSQKTDRTLIYI